LGKGRPSFIFALALLGWLPFFVGLLSICKKGTRLDLLLMADIPVSGAVFMLTYAAIALSFLGGITWGHTMIRRWMAPDSLWPDKILYVWSLLIHWAGWFSLLLGPRSIAFIWLGVCYVAQWVVDFRLSRWEEIPVWFGQVRSVFSPVAIFSLFLVGYLLKI